MTAEHALARADPSEQLLRGPADFDDFWRSAWTESSLVETSAERVRVVARDERWVTTQVRYRSTGGLRIGGWIREPADGVVDRGIVRITGYGGLGGMHEADPPLGVGGAVELFPVLRGLGALSLVDGIPSGAAEHVLHGIASRETYVHRGCVQDAWLAVTALGELVPRAAGRIDVTGGSFGGGIAALALPWDARVQRAFLTVPSFGNHPERLRTPCQGSGESVRRAVTSDPSIRAVLPYFDAATSASRVRIPVMVAAALVDPAVPPIGQHTIHRALGGPSMLLTLTAGHAEHAGLDREMRVADAATAAWLS